MTIPAYPLSWPTGWRRTSPERRAHGKFGKRERQYGQGHSWSQRKDLSIADAVRRVREELQRMGVRDDDLVISSNLHLRLDGMPRSDQRQPADPGVAVYWRDSGDMRCMAVDRYAKVEHNLAAIAATLEAMRAIERHGGAEILDRAFTGFAALPGPAAVDWRTELGFMPSDNPTREEIDRHYRDLIRGQHPDQGGDPEVFQALNLARDAARKECP